MLWEYVLTGWKKGIVLKYPKNIEDSCEWNTSVLKNNK